MALKSTAYLRLLPLLAAVAFLLAAFAGCRRGPDSRLARADSLMETRPDSALALLHSIPSASLASESDRAFHALLLTQARHKNYIDESSDSLIAPAVAYFANHRLDSLLMRALYYNAVIDFNAGKFTDSYRSLLEAMHIARSLDAPLWIARISDCLASLNIKSAQPDDAISFSSEAARIFDSIAMPAHAWYSRLYLASEYLGARRYDEAEALLRSLALDDSLPDYPARLLLVNRCLLPCYYYTGNYSAASAVSAYLSANSHLAPPSAYDLSIRCLLETRIGNPRRARRLLDSLFIFSRTIAEQASACRAAAHYYASVDSMGKSALFADSAFNLLCLGTDSVLRNSAAATHRDFVNSRLQKEQLRSRTLNTLLVVGTTAALLLVAVIILLYRLHIIRKNHVIETKIAEILALYDVIGRKSAELGLRSESMQSLRLEIESERLRSNALHAEVQALYRDSWSLLNRLCTDLINKADSSDKMRRSILTGIEENIRLLNSNKKILELKEAVNKYMDGILLSLEKQVPELSFDETSLAAMLFAGMSGNSISFILGISLNTFYRRRLRLAKKIADSGAPASALFISSLGLDPSEIL